MTESAETTTTSTDAIKLLTSDHKEVKALSTPLVRKWRGARKNCLRNWVRLNDRSELLRSARLLAEEAFARC